MRSGAGFFPDSFDVLQNPQGFLLGEWWKSQPSEMALFCGDECRECGIAARVMFWIT